MPDQPEADNARCSIVGIGASAGGVEALRALFTHLPTDLCHAYVVIVHLSPRHDSDLAHILSRCTTMPVTEVRDSAELEPDHVYVISPNHKLEIADNTITATEFNEPQGPRTAIDVFFRSLAANHGDGFAVILSGGGSDGALGAKALKEAGGLILVQDPKEAIHAGMPEAAIHSGVADIVAPVFELAVQLGNFTRNKQQLMPILQPPTDSIRLNEEDERQFGRILELLRTQTDNDFTHYKRATILRRMGRRMQLVHAATFADYLRHMFKHPEEVPALRDDLLITVTSFFRDPEAWESLRKHAIGPLIGHSGAEEAIRAWVAGCATGEEAYSLAIMLHEEMDRLNEPHEMIVFASDIDEESLVEARHGIYAAAAIEHDVPEALRQRYFVRHGDNYRISDRIRNCVVFAKHNVFRDPPFSGIHLLSCRNLLIYLERGLQDQVQAIFRYACRDDGYLFLGSSETASGELFRPINKHFRVFRMGPRPPDFGYLQTGMRARLPFGVTAFPERRSPRIERASHLPKIHLDLLEKAMPPSMLVNHDRRVVHLSTSAGRFMQPRGGEMGNTIDDLLRQELRDEARSALDRAFSEGRPSQSSPVPVQFNGHARRVSILVHPGKSADSDDALALLLFLEGDTVQPVRSGDPDDAHLPAVLELREQLGRAEKRIDSMDAEHANTLQDLRAANEELQSLNEEYRSTAEELETSKEELQSVNEELQTVNTELRIKLEDTARAHSDLENLLSATHIATLFLDRNLCIKRFTPRLTEIFNVKEHDHGRPISDFSHNLEYGDLADHARGVLVNLMPVEYEVKTTAGETLMVRVFPYRTSEDRIDGVVMNFVDITHAKVAEERLMHNRKQLEMQLVVTQRLHRMSMTVATATSQQQALDEIMAAAMDLLEADFGVLEAWDPDRGLLRIIASHGIRPTLLKEVEEGKTIDGSASFRAVRTRRAVQISDVTQDEDYRPVRHVAAELGYHAVQSTPLMDARGEVIGALSTMYREPKDFPVRIIQLADLLARQASLLIFSGTQQRTLADMYEQLKARAGNMEASEELMKRQALVLQEQDHAKEEFLSVLGHELRNPLAAMRNSLELVQMQRQPGLLDDGNSHEAAVQIMNRQVRNMTRLVNDLLDITRINQGKLRLNLDSIDLATIVTESVNAMTAEFTDANLHVEFAQPAQPLFARGDYQRIGQVVENLLRNALKFTGPGGTISITLNQDQLQASVSVKDTGIGMDPADIEKLFLPYQQAHEGGRGGGLGLGLALCRKLMELHGGEITGRSDGPGLGSEFSFRLPLADARASNHRFSEAKPYRRLRILVVDDDRDNADSLAVLLASLGQETSIAHDGKTGLQVAREFRPDVVFLDDAMPGMRGSEVAKALRGKEFADRHIMVIGLSGNEPKGQTVDFDRYILKPATLDSILEILQVAPGN